MTTGNLDLGINKKSEFMPRRILFNYYNKQVLEKKVLTESYQLWLRDLLSEIILSGTNEKLFLKVIIIKTRHKETQFYLFL